MGSSQAAHVTAVDVQQRTGLWPPGSAPQPETRTLLPATRSRADPSFAGAFSWLKQQRRGCFLIPTNNALKYFLIMIK